MPVVLEPLEEEERALLQDPPTMVGDLAHGGQVGAAELYPTEGGVRQALGRPNAIRFWTWNGTESLVPLAWDKAGKVHDAGRAYLLKRFCLCCHTGGFKPDQKRGIRCPNCEHNRCSRCNSGLDRETVNVLGSGDSIKGWIIPNFYRRKEDVPFPERFYGDIDCFLVSCVRRGGMGFKTEQDMRMHARSRHRMEYQVHQEIEQATRADELESLRAQVAALTVAQLQGQASQAPSAPEAPVRKRARATRKVK